MHAAVGWSAPPLHRSRSLRRPSLPSSSLLRQHPPLHLLTSVPTSQSSSRKCFSSPRLLPCRCITSSSSTSSSTSRADWDWATWNRHFSEIDQAESFLSLLKFQLEEAIENEDFVEAAKLKKSIAEATLKDVVAQVMSDLKNAIEEQRYHDASKLSRFAGTGLIGWWVGHAKNLAVSFGRIVRITPEVGRYVARSYSPRQLLVKSSGTPLFEIFLLRDDDGQFTMKVVSLQSTRVSESSTEKSSSKQERGDDSSTEKDDDAVPQDSNISEPEEAIKKLVGFLKERISSFNVQVLSDSVSEEVKLDMDSVQQLMEEEEEEEDNDRDDFDDDEVEEEIKGQEEDDEENETGDDSGEEIGDLNQDTNEIGSDLDKDNDKVKLFIGGVLHNREDVSNVTYRRVPAEIRSMEKDSFVLHIPRKGPKDMEFVDVVTQVSSELSFKSSDMAKAFLGASKGRQKGRKAKGIQDLLNFASSEIEHRISNMLSEDTIFNRISADTDSLDPFTGLYVGSYGPHGPEVVQLQRKYGHWGGSDELSSGLEFFEYVEAVKLTGDLNVPAGEVTFRAKIGKGNRVSNNGMFPEGLGVTSSYSGQGRTAQPGFKDPQWVHGELLELNGKGMAPIKGAELGFLYIIPDQSFLVLFNRLHLPQ